MPMNSDATRNPAQSMHRPEPPVPDVEPDPQPPPPDDLPPGTPEPYHDPEGDPPAQPPPQREPPTREPPIHALATGPNGAQGDRMMPRTPPPMQH
ncbi:hypothetical protein [Burkholderia sp. FL-7-2-10-S1-D7]|uniref:hypothetical protein n=1 Tax=Burkholderia sp. FL-7-2-10-S1-D7 TaxID=1637866 RepID=UPI0009EA94EB|nr:hypothetical protein [Burkholderia sp. FL-7-2-10-S1-D7]